jgi:hypothetical protein
VVSTKALAGISIRGCGGGLLGRLDCHGWRRVEGTPSVELLLGGGELEYGVEVGMQGAELVCVEADLKLAAFCQGF